MEILYILLSRNEDLNTSHEYGKWDIPSNVVELNDKGWQIFEMYRKEVRKLKPLLELLEKSAG